MFLCVYLVGQMFFVRLPSVGQMVFVRLPSWTDGFCAFT